MHNEVLVLNQSYTPLDIISLERSIKHIVNGKAEVIEHSGDLLRSQNWSLELPLVIRLKSYVNTNKPKRIHKQFNKKNLLDRDDYECQYCGKSLDMRTLTMDHVHPRSKGGKTSWSNIVACCKECNKKKDDKSLKDCGFKLRKKITVPYTECSMEMSIIERLKAKTMERKNDVWDKYFYWRK